MTARRAYYASVAETDEQVGRLLAALEGAGLGAETAVVLHADHGWSLGEHNSWRKMTLFETATRVPLVVALPPGRLPAGRAGARVEEVVELQDVYPTVAALAGLALPRGEAPPVAGRSLLPLVVGTDGAAGPGNGGGRGAGGAPRDRVAFSQYPRHVPDPAAPWANNTAVDTERAQFTAMGYSVRSDGFRYNAWRRWDGRALRADWSAAGVLGEELYDHRATGRGGPVDYDRVENVNLLGNGTGPAPPLLDQGAREALRALRARLEAQFNPPATAAV